MKNTQDLVDSSSGMKSFRKIKQLYQLDDSDSSTSKDTYKPRRRKIVRFFFFKLIITNEAPNAEKSMNQNTFF